MKKVNVCCLFKWNFFLFCRKPRRPDSGQEKDLTEKERQLSEKEAEVSYEYLAVFVYSGEKSSQYLFLKLLLLLFYFIIIFIFFNS